MPSFAVAAEGATDQLVIERMIEQLCGEDDVDVTFVQPTQDATDRHHAPHAGWGLVLDYCRHRAGDALAANDYLVVQLDTDRGEDFGVPLSLGGARRPPLDLVIDSCAVVAGHIGSATFDALKHRIIFAISVDSLESWLLLILHDDGAITTGFKRLSHAQKLRGERPLVKTIERYRLLAGDIRRKRLLHLAEGDHSLGVFLRDLIAICLPPVADPA